MKKRILSVLLAALMIVGSIGTFAIGTSAAEALTFSVNVGEIQSDDTVHVQIDMTNNTGVFAGVKILLEYDNTVIVPVDFDKVWDPQKYDNVVDTVLFGTTECKLAEEGVDKEALTGVAFNAFTTNNYKMPSGKVIGYTFKVLDREAFTNLTLTIDCTNQDKENVTPTIKNGFIGQLSLDELTMANKNVTYNQTAHGLDIVGLDSEMSVAWTLNGSPVSGKFTEAGTYDLTAVVSKPGYKSKTLTGTLVIEKALAALTGVELWVAVEGSEEILIKSAENAAAEVLINNQLKGFPVNCDNAKVVKDGDTYKVEGVVITSNSSIELADTTVVPTFVSADEIVDAVIEQAEIVAPAVHPQASKLPAPEVELPYGYTLELVPVEGVVDADGNITRPEDKDLVTDVTYNVKDAEGNVVGETVLTYTIGKKVTSDSALSFLLLYYHKKLADAKTPVETVKASVASGSAVAAGTTVTLTSATEGATIYYTTDGSTATVLSNVYTGPIAIEEGMTISAIAKKSGMKTSAPATFTYTIAATSITLKADAANIKFMEGRGDKFEPEANATRYEVIKAIANVFDIKTTNAALELTDVAAEYKELVDRCTAAGIIKGYEDKTFKGNDPITRAEVATIICNVMGLDVDGAKDAGFKDVSGWATNYVNACANAGYVKGQGEGVYAPGANITRAELAQLIANITGAKAVDGGCSYEDVVAGKWYTGIVSAVAK